MRLPSILINNKTRKLYKQLLNTISPHVFVYLISNDTFFLASFLKKFKLNIPHTIIQYKSAEAFFEETFIQKPNKKNISVIISEYIFEDNNEFNSLNGLDMFEIIQHTLPESFVTILAKKNEVEEIKNTNEHIEIVVKNSNAHIRLQNIIYSIYNFQNIDVQRNLNIFLGKTFLIIILLLLILCVLL